MYGYLLIEILKYRIIYQLNKLQYLMVCPAAHMRLGAPSNILMDLCSVLTSIFKSL